MARSRRATCSGFTLLEVLAALLLLTAAAAGVAGLVTVSLRAAQDARMQTFLTALALEKVEQLRSLSWAFDGGVAVSDLTTDLSGDQPAAGSLGLRPSPAGTLQRDTAGYVDYLDATGSWVGGASPPPASVFVRRWSIEPLADDPGDTVVLRAFVTTLTRARLEETPRPAQARPGQVLLVTVMTRKDR